MLYPFHESGSVLVDLLLDELQIAVADVEQPMASIRVEPEISLTKFRAAAVCCRREDLAPLGLLGVSGAAAAVPSTLTPSRR